MDQADSANREIARESLVALDVLRVAKNAFFWVAVVTVALHLAAWFMARSRAAPATPAGTAVVETEVRISDRIAQSLEQQLSLIGFVGRSSVLVVNGAFMLALFVSLVGRLGGAAGLTKSCVWALAALAMVAPWVSADVRQMISFRSAFFAEDELYSTGDGVVVLVRFVICPLLVAVFLLIAQLEFRSVYRRISAPSGTRLPIHEV